MKTISYVHVQFQVLQELILTGRTEQDLKLVCDVNCIVSVNSVDTFVSLCCSVYTTICVSYLFHKSAIRCRAYCNL